MHIEGDDDIWNSDKPLKKFTKPASINDDDWKELMKSTNGGTVPLKNIKNKWWKMSVFRNRLSAKKIVLTGIGAAFLGILGNAWV